MSDKQVQLFNNPSFGELRTIQENGKVLFVASDVAKALRYTNPSKAISDHCKGVTKRYVPTAGGSQSMNVIPEGDLYRLVAKSEMPDAEKFESWIFDEVLPTIRKTGMYVTEEAKEKLMRKAVREEAYLLNAKSRAIRTIERCIKDSRLSPIAVTVFGLAQIKEITGQIVEFPTQTERHYSATEIAEELGVSAALIGRLSNTAYMKTDQYGIWVLDKSASSVKQVSAFRYNAAGRDKLAELVAERQRKAQ